MQMSFLRFWQEGFFISTHTQAKIEAVPCFSEVDEFRNGLVARQDFAPIDLYPRDGTRRLHEVERQAAALARVEDEELVLLNSGMTAVKAAVEVALDNTDEQDVTVAHGRELYGQTLQYLNRYIQNDRVRLVSFDSGDAASVDRTIEQRKPQIIVAETVSNGPSIALLDIGSLKTSVAKHVPESTVVLDNTLPLSTALPLGEQLTSSEKTLVVESGTKSYTFNGELAGLVYGKNPELIRAVRSYRRTTGTMPGLGSLERIQALLPSTTEAFDSRNQQLYRATGQLALHLHEAEKQGADFVVSHPSLATHQNKNYAERNYPRGVTPLLFLHCTGKTNQYELTERLWADERVREQADIGQSFGFDRTRILPDEHWPYVRIAGGAFTQTDELGAALVDAALQHKEEI